MDYQAFFADIVDWINQANQTAVKHGMQSEQFWSWVSDSSKRVCDKYGNNRLAINQMLMLIEWLEEFSK